MRYREVISPRVRSLLLRQAGIITLDQAGRLGLTTAVVRRLVGQGHWRRVAEGLYDTSPLQAGFIKSAWLAMLHAGPDAAIGGDAALRLSGLRREPTEIEVWVPPTQQRVTSPAGVRVRRDFLGRAGRAGGVLRRIRPVDAVLDVGQQLETTELVALLSDTLRLRLATIESLLSELDGRQRVRQRSLFVTLLGDLEGIESVLEYEYRRDVERAHGLPTGARQVSVSSGTRTDVLYEEYGVLVELDGTLGHLDAADRFRDLGRDNRHAVRGKTTLRYGSRDVRGQPCAVGVQVTEALQENGWPGQRLNCPRCPPG